MPKIGKVAIEKKIAINLPYTSFMRHTYFLSKSGSGKSELLKLITYEMMRSSSNNSNKSIVLIDPHGDLCLDIMKFSMNSKALQNRISYQLEHIGPFLADRPFFF